MFLSTPTGTRFGHGYFWQDSVFTIMDKSSWGRALVKFPPPCSTLPGGDRPVSHWLLQHLQVLPKESHGSSWRASETSAYRKLRSSSLGTYRSLPFPNAQDQSAIEIWGATMPTGGPVWEVREGKEGETSFKIPVFQLNTCISERWV